MKFRFSLLILLLLISTKYVGAQTYNYIDVLVNSVYNNLNEAIGDISHEPPTLVLSSSKRSVARYIPSINKIEFEYAAYEICRKLGPDSLNAVAFILAHELAHYYRDHSWLSKAGTAYIGTDLGQKLQDLDVAMDTTIKYEAEADEFSYYYSKIAGYSIKAAPILYDSLYSNYSLPNDIPHYPSLAERKEISLRVQENANDLNKLFDLASVLILKGEYNCAAILYRQILNSKFGSREIFNNLGVVYAFEGLKYVKDGLSKIDFPFSIELTSRLSESQRSTLKNDSLKSLAYFKKADDMFNKAIKLDDNYLPSKINTVIISALLQDFRRANYLLDGLREVSLSNEIIPQTKKCVDELFRLYNQESQHNEEFNKVVLIFDSLDVNLITLISLPESPIFPTNRKALGAGNTLRFQNGEGSVHLFRKDSMGWEMNLIDFKGNGGFNRNFRFAILEDWESKSEVINELSESGRRKSLILGKKKILNFSTSNTSQFYILDNEKVEKVFLEYF